MIKGVGSVELLLTPLRENDPAKRYCFLYIEDITIEVAGRATEPSEIDCMFDGSRNLEQHMVAVGSFNLMIKPLRQPTLSKMMPSSLHAQKGYF